jgi:hypothetical protein
MPAWLIPVTVLVTLPLTMPNGVPLWIAGNTSVTR